MAKIWISAVFGAFALVLISSEVESQRSPFGSKGFPCNSKEECRKLCLEDLNCVKSVFNSKTKTCTFVEKMNKPNKLQGYLNPNCCIDAGKDLCNGIEQGNFSCRQRSANICRTWHNPVTVSGCENPMTAICNYYARVPRYQCLFLATKACQDNC